MQIRMSGSKCVGRLADKLKGVFVAGSCLGIFSILIIDCFYGLIIVDCFLLMSFPHEIFSLPALAALDS